MGKSASGKDTVYRRLLEDRRLGLHRLITGTTRPIRENEADGREYDFYTEGQFQELLRQGKIIESRAYNTVQGLWHYFTVARRVEENEDYLTINTLEAYSHLKEYYGECRVVPIYLYVDDGLRLQRALDRERAAAEPQYAEMCRRFLTDDEDFSAEKLSLERIGRDYGNEFINDALDDTVEEISGYIRRIKDGLNG